MSNPINDRLQKFGPEEVASLYKKVFGTEEGELVLEDLKNRCFMKITPFTGHDSETNFNNGMQAVVLHIDTQIKYKPDENEEKESEE